MGKTSLANTFAEFLKSPTKAPKPVLTEGTPLRYTKVMELYDGLSIGMRKNISVEVTDHARNVKLVKLKVAPAEENESTSQTKVGNTSSSGTVGKGKSKPSKAPLSAPVKEGKRKRIKKMFASLFTGAPHEISADEENAREENKTGEDSDIEDNKTPDETSTVEGDASEDNKTRVKLIDLGGHSATTVLVLLSNFSVKIARSLS